MKEVTKEDVIEVVSTIENPAVLQYLYIFIENMKANYSLEKIQSKEIPHNSK